MPRPSHGCASRCRWKRPPVPRWRTRRRWSTSLPRAPWAGHSAVAAVTSGERRGRNASPPPR
eukprot:5329003-Lingulodinium_polyedra.AAC.1